jgi:serine/threonine protein kinase/tetratricopeptide (TPR) repeat protein
MADPTEETAGPDGTVTVSAEAAAPDLRIGAYRILRELGRGGMGTVYLAVRADEQFRKRVAIKMAGGGPVGEDAARRFRRERQILASLDHSNIAKLLDGGTTESGQPYIVMEYIEGQTINQYCETRQLPTAERLVLFRMVCSAVQYAHSNLVVHRDIKPANVLVTAEGLPKLLDFGVAKLLNPELSGEPLTATGLALTPEYASPEQARGETITTASDVYSLGVLLYELLTRQRPYRLKSREVLEVLRAVCEEEPQKPSTAVARTEDAAVTDIMPRTTGSGGQSPVMLEKLRRRLRGDLDNIMMALRKEPQRRYSSVEALSEDIRRHLAGLPVMASVPTLRYRSGKFIRRHKAAVAFAALAAILVVAFGVTAAVQSAQIARERDRVAQERDRATREKDRAEKVAQFLVGLFKASQPSQAQGKVVSARELLDTGAARTKTELRDQPDARAALLHAIGDTYMALGLNDQARPLLEEALAERRRLFPGDHADVAATLSRFGLLLHIQGDVQGAEALYRETLAMRRRLRGNEHPEVATSLSALAGLLRDRGDVEAGEAMEREALAIMRKNFAPNSPQVLSVQNNIGLTLAQKGDLAGAESTFRQVLGGWRSRGEQRPGIGVALENLGDVLFDERKFAEAESVMREGLELMQRLLGKEDWRVAIHLTQLADLLLETERSRDGEASAREAVRILRAHFAGDHPLTAAAQSVLGAALAGQGRYAEAEPLLVQSEKFLGTWHDRAARRAQERLARLYTAWGKPGETLSPRP